MFFEIPADATAAFDCAEESFDAVAPFMKRLGEIAAMPAAGLVGAVRRGAPSLDDPSDPIAVEGIGNRIHDAAPRSRPAPAVCEDRTTS